MSSYSGIATMIFTFITVFASPLIGAESNGSSAMVVPQFFEEAKKNTHWKTAFATGKSEQIIFMYVSPATNPANEIGEEVHPFDQVILIVEGEAKAVLNGETSAVKGGDMIFIPQGVKHNVINSNLNIGLKLISFYSATDIPKGAVYKMKSDQSKD